VKGRIGAGAGGQYRTATASPSNHYPAGVVCFALKPASLAVDRAHGVVCYLATMRLVWLRGLGPCAGVALGALTFACQQGEAPPINGSLVPGVQPPGVTPISPVVPPTAPTTTTSTTTTTTETPAPTTTDEPTSAVQDSTAVASAEPTDVASVPAGDAGGVTAPTPTSETVAPVDCEAACTAAGGTCQEGNTCVFTCADVDSCATAIQCPDDLNCRIDCMGANSCAGAVACPANGAQSCEVNCGQDACKAGVECGASTCTVNCANGACKGVSGGADTFTLNCSGDGSCSDANLACNAQNCNISCTGSGACMRGDINISANNANLQCQGNGACSQAINCSAGTCNVTCNTSVSACGTYCAQAQKPQGCP
jgi:hypothetical protein